MKKLKLLNLSSLLSMKYYISLLAFATPLSLNGQFAKVSVNNEQTLPQQIQNFELRSTGDTDLVGKYNSELYHITSVNDTAFRYSVLESTQPDVIDFVLYDIDLDGDKDLLARASFARVHVYLKEDGRFIYTPQLTISNVSRQLGVLDFNGDGVDDLMKDHSIFITTGPNQQEFATRLVPAPSDVQTNWVSWDYDADGDNDIVFNNVSKLVAYENDGQPTLTQKLDIDHSFSNISWCTLIQTTAGPRFLFRNPSTGLMMLSWTGSEFVSTFISDIVSTPFPEVTHFDLNGDGNEEIVLNSSVFSFNPNTETGTVSSFTPIGTIIGRIERSGGNWIFSGAPDKMHLIQLGSDFEPTTIFTTKPDIATAGFGFGDFDGDGFVDVLSTTGIKRYQDHGAFEKFRTLTYPDGNGSLLDFDADGDLDYVNEGHWYANLGNYSFGPETAIPDPTPDPNISFTREILRKDMDGDGDKDILTYNHFGEPLQLLKNNNNQSFSSPVTLATSEHIAGQEVYINIHDLNHDGINDIVMAAASGLIMLKGKPGLAFDPAILLYDLPGAQNDPLTVEVEDINLDGLPEILLGTIRYQAGSVFGITILFSGSSDLPQGTIVHEGPGAHRSQFANIDNTGWKDIVFSHYEGLFWSTTTDGTSFITDLIDTDFTPNEQLFIADVNLDNDDDIIVSLGPVIYYYLNGDEVNDIALCPYTDLYYFTQEQVDRFRAQYGGCRVIPGSLYIHNHNNEPNMTDLSCFQNIREVKGNLEITGINLLPDLTGFSNLTRVGQDLVLDNPYALSLTGLDKINYIGGDVSLLGMFYANAPEDLQEFEKVDTLGGSIRLKQVAVSTLAPLARQVIHGDLELVNVTVLNTQEGLDIIDTIDGTLTVNNLLWSNLEGFSNLKQIGGLRVVGNTLLEAINILHAQESIDQMVEITSNPKLVANSGFESLKYVGGDFNFNNPNCSIFNDLSEIGGHASISTESLAPFQKLHSVGGDLTISRVKETDLAAMSLLQVIPGDLTVFGSEFTTLNGLHNISEVSGDLILNGLPNLSTMDDLHTGLRVGGEWRIEYNPLLAYCNTIPFCSHISNGGAFSITDNGSFCMEESQLECITSLDESSVEQVDVYPNPASDVVYIKGIPAAHVEVTDIAGRLLWSGTYQDHGIQISGLPPGVYVCKIYHGDSFAFARFSKK